MDVGKYISSHCSRLCTFAGRAALPRWNKVHPIIDYCSLTNCFFLSDWWKYLIFFARHDGAHRRCGWIFVAVLCEPFFLKFFLRGYLPSFSKERRYPAHTLRATCVGVVLSWVLFKERKYEVLKLPAGFRWAACIMCTRTNDSACFLCICLFGVVRVLCFWSRCTLKCHTCYFGNDSPRKKGVAPWGRQIWLCVLLWRRRLLLKLLIYFFELRWVEMSFVW